MPENLPRLGPDFEPPVLRDVGATTTVVMQTVDVDAVRVEWRLANGEGTDVTVIGEGEAWKVLGYRAHLNAGRYGGGAKERGFTAVFRPVVDGTVEKVLTARWRTEGPLHRVFGLPGVDASFNVVFGATFAVGNDGPTRIVPVSYTHLTLPTTAIV